MYMGYISLIRLTEDLGPAKTGAGSATGFMSAGEASDGGESCALTRYACGDGTVRDTSEPVPRAGVRGRGEGTSTGASGTEVLDAGADLGKQTITGITAGAATDDVFADLAGGAGSGATSPVRQADHGRGRHGADAEGPQDVEPASARYLHRPGQPTRSLRPGCVSASRKPLGELVR